MCTYTVYGVSMSLDEQAINAVKEYFESITQNAIDFVYESVDSDTTYAEFMESVNHKSPLRNSQISSILSWGILIVEPRTGESIVEKLKK